MKQFFKDFGKFIAKGNVFELAIGVVIGTAFNAIVQSLVKDIIMPLVSGIVRVDVATLKVILVPAVLDDAGEILKPAVTLNYGNFIQTVINFLIISLSIFIALKAMMKIREKMAKVEELVKAKLAKEEKTDKTTEVSDEDIK